MNAPISLPIVEATQRLVECERGDARLLPERCARRYFLTERQAVPGEEDIASFCVGCPQGAERLAAIPGAQRRRTKAKPKPRPKPQAKQTPVPKPKRRRPTVDVVCPACGHTFARDHGKRVYCERSECVRQRESAKRRRYREAHGSLPPFTPHMRPCELCGVKFWAERRNRRQCQRPECDRKIRRERRPQQQAAREARLRS